jgi:hypothetical protein
MDYKNVVESTSKTSEKKKQTRSRGHIPSDVARFAG